MYPIHDTDAQFLLNRSRDCAPYADFRIVGVWSNDKDVKWLHEVLWAQVGPGLNFWK